MSQNINNLNVFTFIKDIYQSLKHIDKCFNDFNTNINTRLTKVEDNQQILIDKLSGIEILLNKINDANTSNGSLNKNIEYYLLEKMNKTSLESTNNLIKQNIGLSKNIYNKIEKGGIRVKNDDNSNKLSRIISLFDICSSNDDTNKNTNNIIDINNNINYNNEYYDENKNYYRKGSDSELSDMDINVETKV